MKKQIAFLIFCWSILGMAQGQTAVSGTNPPQLQSLIPVSPSAAALAKYGALPIGYYTGVPDISIPLYQVNTGKLKLPVSLSYHASGLKVEEIASCVGMGWSLNAGGSISRQTRGRPDEAAFGFLERFTDIRRYLAGQMPTVEKDAYEHDVTAGNVDTQPDVFYYSTPTGSGMFFYDTTGAIMTIPLSRQFIYGAAKSWSITDVDGTEYIFEDAEQTTSSPVNGSLQSTANGYLGPVYSSVFLSRILSFDGSEETRFYYDSTYYSFDAISSQSRYVIASPYSNCPAMDPVSSGITNTIYGRRLRRISFKGGDIFFNAAASDRLDLPGDRALDNIVIRNSDSSFFKKIQFHYSYRGTTASSNMNNTGTDETYRLFLDSITTQDASLARVERYSFDYTPGTLPRRTSYDQDYWGYYNGAANENKFVPTTYLSTPSGLLSFEGANRNTNPAFSQIGMLTKITYPTGGSTHFEFENNTISTTEPGTIYNTEQTGYLGLGTTLNATTFTDSFTIEAFSDVAGATVPVTVALNSTCGGNNQTLGCPLVNLSKEGEVGSIPIVSSGIIQLAAGHYTITADLSDVSDQSLFNSFYVSLSWPKPIKAVYNGATVYQRFDGGHRIKKIWDDDGFGHVQNVKKYDYNLPGTTISSGSVLSLPDFVNTMHRLITDNNVYGSSHTYNCEYKVFSSATNYPLLSTKGSYVGYSFVREILGEDSTGGTNEYTYTSPNTFADINYTDYPYAPSTSYDWKRGLLIRQTMKKKTATGFETVQDKFMDYSEHKDYAVKGLKIGFEGIDFISQSFDLATGWYHLDCDSLLQYDQSDTTRRQAIVTTYNYSENALLPNQIATRDSKGDELLNRVKYAVDYGNYTGADNDALGIQQLKLHNMVASPIETKTIRKVNGSYKVTAGTITTFDPATVKPKAIWQLFAGTNTDTSLSAIATAGFVKDTTYARRVNFGPYTSAGSLLSQYKEYDAVHSYVWDYGELYPIAECVNAATGHIAYTSFEADGRGGWTGIDAAYIDSASRGITGRKYYNATNFSLSKTGLDSTARYIVSYWSKSGPDAVTGTQESYPKIISTITLGSAIWTQYEHHVSGRSAITLNGSGSLDELRLYPADAQMVTYTYTPLLGTTSKCDAAGRISYFEYDSFGRLLCIRDQNDHILKAYEYKYASQ